MRFEASQQMKLGQHMKLAPRMIQSMEILQMPMAELEERIEQELENNPTLEVAEVQPVLEGESPDVDPALEELRRRREHDLHGKVRRNDGERDAKMDAMAAAPARAESLTEHLTHQWSLVDVDEPTRALGEILISFLDADGFLRTPLETIAERAPETASGVRSTAADFERALQAMQLFLEPAGVAARDVKECLLLQLAALRDREDVPEEIVIEHAERIVGEHLDDVMKNRLPRISEKTGLTMEDIKQGLELMKRLSLAPAKQLVEDSPSGIVPDAIVEYDPDSDRYIAYLNDSRLPNLRINQEYAKLIKNRDEDKRTREFLKTNMGNAQWLMDAVEQRRGTLLRVVRAVVEKQREFFDYGASALKPLPMTLVADELGIHVATVSRAVADKYLATPRGVVALRKFFSGGLQTDGGEDMAWDAIKAALEEVVGAEDKAF